MKRSRITNNISGAVIHETGKYPGTRGWAARWEKIDVNIVSAEKWKGGVNNQLMLNIPKSSSKIALVELDEGSYAQNDDSAPEEDEKYWDTFIDLVEELE